MTDQILRSRFSVPFYWTFWGSLIYETLKITHLMACAKVMEPSVYGAMATLLASLYLATDIADLGASYTLPSISFAMLTTRQRVYTVLFQYYALPSGIVAAGCAVALIWWFFVSLKLALSPFVAGAVVCLILGEAARVFLRIFLRACFKAQQTVIIELPIIFMYVGVIWAYYSFYHTIPLELIFAAHLFDSVLALVAFLLLLWQWTKQLPVNDQAAPLPLPAPVDLFSAKVLINRTSNYLLRLTRRMFTSNFLTPLFAYRFGLGPAGCFYVASTFSSSLLAIMRYSFAYSGAAYLASVSSEGLAAKKDAFMVMNRRLFGVLVPHVLCLVFSYHALVVLVNRFTGASTASVSLALMFLLVTSIDFFFMLYEQFYIVESMSFLLLIARFAETASFYLLFAASEAYAPLFVLSGLVVIRLVSCFFVALRAYRRWGIRPTFSFDLVHTVLCIGISIALNLLAFVYA